MSECAIALFLYNVENLTFEYELITYQQIFVTHSLLPEALVVAAAFVLEQSQPFQAKNAVQKKRYSYYPQSQLSPVSTMSTKSVFSS